MSEPVHLDILERATIATPCPARWEDMAGDDKTRRCELCDLNVHNIAAMTREEAEQVLAPVLDGQRVCAKIYRRSDGTILTRDCPVGVRAARAKAMQAARRVAAVIVLAITSGTVFGMRHRAGPGAGGPKLAALQPFKTVYDWLVPPPPPPSVFIMGDIRVPRREVDEQGRPVLKGLTFNEARERVKDHEMRKSMRSIEEQLGHTP